MQSLALTCTYKVTQHVNKLRYLQTLCLNKMLLSSNAADKSRSSDKFFAPCVQRRRNSRRLRHHRRCHRRRRRRRRRRR